MNRREQLTALTAVKKIVNAQLGALKDEEDAALLEAYEQTGGKSYDLKLSGVKVGTYSVVCRKVTEVTDAGALGAWMAENVPETHDINIRLDWLTSNQLERVAGLIEDMGRADCVERTTTYDWQRHCQKLPDGTFVSWEGETIPGVHEVEKPTGCMLRVDEKKVIPLLPPQVAGMLEGGERQ